MDVPFYLTFCPADSLFYDIPVHDGGRFERSDAEPPPGWVRRTDREWVNILPPVPLPSQGWKVHVSATPENSAAILDVCWTFCVERDLGFKFLRSVETVTLRSGKYGDRSASGKFVTIYTRDDDELEQVLRGLAPRLDGQEGPAVLSDLRWGGGPLYVRYGGFELRPLRLPTGEQVWAVETPDGRLVPDERRPGFHPPDWVELPAILREAVAARAQGRLDDFPYRPTRALHFSNGGGVYRGVDASGQEILLKEARPLAGLDGVGDDAVTRLERERWAYETLAPMPEIPELLDFRIGHEHYFLARELVEGEQLNVVALRANPLLRPGATAQEFETFSRWALDVLGEVERAVSEMHRRGVIFADLHPGNILVGPDGTLRFIDLESAQRIDADGPQAMGAPVYIAPPTFRGAEIDWYGFGIMMLDLFVPLVRMVNWESGKLEVVLDLIEERFAVPPSFRSRVQAALQLEKTQAAIANEELAPLSTLSDLSGPTDWAATSEAEGWTSAAGRVAQGILATATPTRADRLFPGDPRQLVAPQGGVTFSHGAAGVLWTLRACGIEVPEEHDAWFRSAVETASWTQPGFGDGLAGVAFALNALGHAEAARSAGLTAASLVDEWTPLDLFAGRAGVALVLLELGRDLNDPELLSAADRVGEPLLSVSEVDPRRPPGLVAGCTGEALYCLRQFERTGEPRLLEAAEAHLRRDLTTLGWDPQGEPDPEAPVDAHLEVGAGGTAIVADQLVRRRPCADLRRLADEVLAAAAVPLVVESGLWRGHAGLMTVISHLRAAGDPQATAVLAEHARALDLHLVGFRGQPLPTGHFNLRLSADFATGAAGLLLALTAIDQPVRFPLL